MSGSGIKLPAEWEHNECVLLSWPHDMTDWTYMLPEVQACFVEIASAIARYAKVLIIAPDINEPTAALVNKTDINQFIFASMPTNDTWARDFGMICTIGSDGHSIINDYKFNGWGLKFAANNDNLVNRTLLFVCNLIAEGAEYANRLNFVLEGGSIESDGRGTVMTTTNCLLSPNRNGASTKAEIERYLKQTLGADRILWVEHGNLEGDDTDSHIDTLARMLPGDVIALSTCDRPDDSHYTELDKMHRQISSFVTSEGRPYTLVELPIPRPIYDDEGQRLPATYANFLIINGAVLVPTYGDESYDTIAIERIKAAMPLYDVIGIDCRALIQQHGSLHCMTMQIPEGALNLEI